jgi:hypothetical protein
MQHWPEFRISIPESASRPCFSKSFDIGAPAAPLNLGHASARPATTDAARAFPHPPRRADMSFRSTPDRSPPRFGTVLTRACDRLSRAGVYLLPAFYVGFVAMLFLLWRAPTGAFWLPAAAAALAGAMAVWSLIFFAASEAWSDARKPAAPRATPSRTAMSPVPLRFVQMNTRACSGTCTAPGGASTQFTVSCFDAHCTAGVPKKKPRLHDHLDAA